MRDLKKTAVCILTALLMLLPGFISMGEACVGRKLVIGYLDITEQAILAEVMSILIEERTGTKVELKQMEDSMEAQKALESNDIQIFIEYTGIGLTEILGEAPNSDADAVYKKVKKAYSKNFNLIWLKTFGYSTTSEEIEEEGVPLFAAPVVRKYTLEKFPALARLLNKLNGKISEEIMGKMVAKVDKEGKNPKNVAGHLLSELGIAFSFSPGEA